MALAQARAGRADRLAARRGLLGAALRALRRTGLPRPSPRGAPASAADIGRGRGRHGAGRPGRPLHAEGAGRPHRCRRRPASSSPTTRRAPTSTSWRARRPGRGAAAAAGRRRSPSRAASRASPRMSVAALRYISASGGEPPGQEWKVNVGDVGSLAARGAGGAHSADRQLRRSRRRPIAPCAGRASSYNYDDYAHLARVAEWSARRRGGGVMGLLHVQARQGAVRKRRGSQAAAADPTASAWVSANAGTGKTHVLTMRVLRLLLAGTPPERILALTYTKAAAAEMSKRVFERLAEWVHGRRRRAQEQARRGCWSARPRLKRCSARGSCSPSPSRRRAASRCRPSTPSASGCCSAFRSRPACRRALRSSTTTSGRRC